MSKSKATETVWITANHQSTRNTYHTNKDCERLPENRHTRDKAKLPEQWSECSYCKGEVEIPGGCKTDCPYCGELVIMQRHIPTECDEL